MTDDRIQDSNPFIHVLKYLEIIRELIPTLHYSSVDDLLCITNSALTRPLDISGYLTFNCQVEIGIRNKTASMYFRNFHTYVDM